MDITLCMIVKNEENNLKKCLESIKKYVSEIIIIDTGSVDKTKEIAREYSNKIYDFKWCNNFAKARNFSLEKASNDWVLVLDADEVITEFNISINMESFKNNEKLVGRIKRINIIEDEKGNKKYIERVNRLFNKKYYNYQGIIHEQVVAKSGLEYKTINIDIIADHIGYMQEIIKNTEKLKRNLELLQESIKINDNDPYLYYQLGKTFYLSKQYEDAFKSFNKALNLNVNIRYEYVEDLIETYGYTLINTGRYNEGLALKKYEKYYGDIVDYMFLMALIYMNNGMFENAVNLFLDCIGEKEGSIEGLNSYLSYHNIGVIYKCLGFEKEARYYKAQASHCKRPEV